MLKTSSVSKINLYLKVTGKRNDGYHNINSVFLPLENPSDSIEISIQKSKKINIEISCDDDSLPADDSNLCWQAAERYLSTASLNCSCSINLKKNIPVAAGLGGGSSNAAAVLRLLNSHYGKFQHDKLSEIALSIGADVPFFLEPSVSLVKGIGEKIKRFSEIDYSPPLLLLFPGFPISRRWAYKNISQAASKPENNPSAELMLEALKHKDPEMCASLLRNDLAPAAYRKFPLLKIIYEKFIESGALAVEISGSGSSIFGIFTDKEALEEGKNAMEEHFGDAFKIFLNF